MPLGWIDFSKSERNKVLSVLDLLSEPGTLDELGIAPIRDGFANLFFPGTSTIQTRAKYFFIVPYALKDLEHSSEINPNRMLQTFNEIEKGCGMLLLNNGVDTEGVIGNRTLANGSWVKRTPADIYWAGLHSYGFFTYGNLSLTAYVKAVCAQKAQKATLVKLGNRNDNAEDNEADDKDAGNFSAIRFWNMPTYSKYWKKNLTIKLTKEEGAFLKSQIIKMHPDSLMAYILNNKMTQILDCKSFTNLSILMNNMPEQIRTDYLSAQSFSNFIYVIRIIYNIIISDNKNEAAKSEWQSVSPSLSEIASVDLESIFKRLNIRTKVPLQIFLKKEKEQMMNNNFEGMKAEIIRREKELKQQRSKTAHPGEFDTALWYGGKQLDYRFGNAKVIIRDIFESEDINVKSK